MNGSKLGVYAYLAYSVAVPTGRLVSRECILHLSHSIKVYFCNHHTMVGPKYVRRTTRECPTRVLKGCVRY